MQFYTIFCKAAVEERVPGVPDLGQLPPPPPLPTDLGQFKKLKRVIDNDGVGTMAAYMALKKIPGGTESHTCRGC